MNNSSTGFGMITIKLHTEYVDKKEAIDIKIIIDNEIIGSDYNE